MNAFSFHKLRLRRKPLDHLLSHIPEPHAYGAEYRRGCEARFHAAVQALRVLTQSRGALGLLGSALDLGLNLKSAYLGSALAEGLRLARLDGQSKSEMLALFRAPITIPAAPRLRKREAIRMLDELASTSDRRVAIQRTLRLGQVQNPEMDFGDMAILQSLFSAFAVPDRPRGATAIVAGVCGALFAIAAALYYGGLALAHVALDHFGPITTPGGAALAALFGGIVLQLFKQATLGGARRAIQPWLGRSVVLLKLYPGPQPRPTKAMPG
ncbi:hypothetical protein WDL1P1_00876 (plasmid) [Variovorax sp. WDL1]|nr:hypothetical protein CHC06_05533 [Variovorax sp. B2]PNG50824.1 hypothetical protein CHC07_05438 [Variovorax sp. B4]VTV18051.1 hypothetical protein WDL1P1_00876 [Variovorax sp. WDL1]